MFQLVIESTAAIIWRLAMIILGVAIAGCPGPSRRQSQTSNPEPPIQLTTEGSKPITFYRLLFRTPAAQKIIESDLAVLKDTQFPYPASVEFDVIAHAELRHYGYTVLGTESVVFNQNDWESARYQLGGTVTEMKLPVSQVDDQTQVVIEWQFYDAVEKDVLFRAVTSGSGQGEPSAGASPIFGAFRSALHTLLANPDFVAQAAASSPASQVATMVEKEPLVMNCEAPLSLTLPRDLKAVAPSIVTLQGGGAHGSGVIVSSDGYILTAEHVVSGAQQVEAHLQSGLRLPAQVIRVDKGQDVGLLKLPGASYVCMAMRLDGPASIGSEIYVIGTPWRPALAFSISKGVLSGKRMWNGAEYVQTDASVNPGNSGGPLLDRAGQIVGIVSWKTVGSKYEGLAFGVPMGLTAERLRLRSGPGADVTKRYLSSERVSKATH